MKPGLAGVVSVGMLVVAFGPAVPTRAAPPSTPRAVNVTRDSAPGWRPTPAEEQQVPTGIDAYFSAHEGRHYQRAYEMLTPGQRGSLPEQQFAERMQQFQTLAGPLMQRTILKITWTKDPPAPQIPGVYAAVDVAARYANVDRYCGYLMLYQSPAGGDFQVMHQETNFIDNKTAAAVEAQQSRAGLDSVWAKLAAICPNYAPPRAPAPPTDPG
jgi:hypothetical protein